MLNKTLTLVIPILSFLQGFSQKVHYNKNYQIACHNCYEPRYASNIEDVLTYATSIEIDIWDNEIAFGLIGNWLKSNKMEHDWYVKHEPQQRGNFNCCGGTFRDCLNRLKKWSDNNLKHHVITIFIDKKENWSDNNETRKPTDLDSLLLSIFGTEKIFVPSMLLGRKKNLKVASLNNDWQTLDSLEGKFIFVITNGTGITFRNPLNEYLNSQKSDAICFVAPEIVNETEIQNPKNFSEENSKNIIFYNLKYASRQLVSKINEINCLSRVYCLPLPETNDLCRLLIAGKVNFIAIYNYKLLK